MLVIKQVSYNYNSNATKIRILPPAREAIPTPCVTECKATFGSDAVWSSDRGGLETLI